MDLSTIESVRLGDALIVLAICMATALIAAIALLVVAARQIARIEIPEEADFFETLQHIPITVPLALDLLDLVFDFFSAPISWVILELLGLQSLQMVTIFESLIPGTQVIPTMTIAWFIARMMKRKKRTELRSALHDYQLGQRRLRYSQLHSGSSPIADQYRRRALPAPYDDPIDGEYFEEDLDEPPPGHFAGEEEEDW